MPFNNRDGLFYVKYLLLTAFKPVACKHFLWSSRWYLGKNRSAAGQTHAGRARQIENIIAVQKYSEHFSSADNTNAAVRCPSTAMACSKRGASGIPEIEPSY